MIISVVYVAVVFAIGASDPDELAFLSTESAREVHLNKTDGGYGLVLDWNTIVGVSSGFEHDLLEERCDENN